MEKAEAVECENELRQLVQGIGASFLDVGQKLLKCRRTQWYRLLGFDTLDAFVERSLQMSGRTGRYLVRVYEFYVEENQISTKQLGSIGWTKLEKLLPILEGKTRTEHAIEFVRWFAYAGGHTVRELEVEILSHLTPEQKEKSGLRSAYTVPVTEGQRDVINRALEIVKKQTGSNDVGAGFEYLAADYLSGAPREGKETEESTLVTRAFRLMPEQDLVVQKALFVIRSSRQESDPDALVRICQFFLVSAKAATGKAA